MVIIPGPGRAVALMLLAVLCVACGGAAGSDSDTGTDAAPSGGDGSAAGDGTRPGPFGAWELIDASPPIDVPEGALVTLELTRDGDAVRLGGTAGCNTYGGTVALDDGWAPGQLLQTEMACGESLMAVESAYLTSLVDATSWRVDDGGDLVVGGGGRELRFAPLVATGAEDE